MEEKALRSHACQTHILGQAILFSFSAAASRQSHEISVSDVFVGTRQVQTSKQGAHAKNTLRTGGDQLCNISLWQVAVRCDYILMFFLQRCRNVMQHGKSISSAALC